MGVVKILVNILVFLPFLGFFCIGFVYWQANPEYTFFKDAEALRAALSERELPDGVVMEKGLRSVLELRNLRDAPVSVALFELPLEAVKGSVLECRARVDLNGGWAQARVEMECGMQDGTPLVTRGPVASWCKNYLYFGHGQLVSTRSATFYLDEGQRVENVSLGVHFDGTGIARLVSIGVKKHEFVSRTVFRLPLAAAAFALSILLQGAVARVLARKPFYPSIQRVSAFALCILLALGAGWAVVLKAMGLPWWFWFFQALSAVIALAGLVVFYSWLFPRIKHEVEERKIAAAALSTDIQEE